MRTLKGQACSRTFRVTDLQVRSAGEGTGLLRFSGYAAVWDEPYEVRDMWGETFMEVMRSGAFTKTIAESDDTRLLLNHDGIPLARRSAKATTLNLLEDEHGLRSEADLDEQSPLVQSVVSAMTRGDLDQMSIGFNVIREMWSPDFTQVDVQEARLRDVSIVTFPASPTTSASLARSALLPEGFDRKRAAMALAELRSTNDPDALALANQVMAALSLTAPETKTSDRIRSGTSLQLAKAKLRMGVA